MRVKVFCSVALALVGAMLSISTPPATAAGSSCAGYDGGAKTVEFKAFAGHKIRVTYRWCNGHRVTDVLPLGYFILRGVSTPVVSLPTRVPSGLGEKVSVTRKPYLYSFKNNLAVFRFSVHQGHVGVPFASDYDFEVRVYSGGKGKICFVNKSCSALQ